MAGHFDEEEFDFDVIHMVDELTVINEGGQNPRASTNISPNDDKVHQPPASSVSDEMFRTW